MYKLWLFSLLVLFTISCVPTGDNGANYEGWRGVRYWHDDERKVSCWLYLDNGIHCIPDSQLR